jgi:hypothetical protein
MNAPETALQGKRTGAAGQLYMAFELGDKKWFGVGTHEREDLVDAGGGGGTGASAATAARRGELGARTPK